MNLREMIKRGLLKKSRGDAGREQQPPLPEVGDDQSSLYGADRPTETPSTRAASTRHGKVTADKRNQ
jgi:hypothetical protein